MLTSSAFSAAVVHTLELASQTENKLGIRRVIVRLIEIEAGSIAASPGQAVFQDPVLA